MDACGTPLTVEETVEECAADPECNVIIHERENKYFFATGTCLSPCFSYSGWGQVADFLNNLLRLLYLLYS